MSNLTNNENNGNGCDLMELINLMSQEKSRISIVSTLWIVLFGLIVVQKVFNYVIKPCRNNRNNDNNKENGNGGNIQNACFVV